MAQDKRREYFISKQYKIDTLLEAYGMSEDEAIEKSMFDSVNPGICMNYGCDYTTDVEPDQDEGWCKECGTGTVKSFCILLGVI
jgi:hypothetical protein